MFVSVLVSISNVLFLLATTVVVCCCWWYSYWGGGEESTKVISTWPRGRPWSWTSAETAGALCRFQVESKSHFASEISIRWAASKLMGFSLSRAISEILPSYFLESMIIHADKKSTRTIVPQHDLDVATGVPLSLRVEIPLNFPASTEISQAGSCPRSFKSSAGVGNLRNHVVLWYNKNYPWL